MALTKGGLVGLRSEYPGIGKKGSLTFFKSRIYSPSQQQPTTANIFSDLPDLTTEETLDPVGSAVRFEVMKLCNWVNKGQQWLVLGGTKSVYCSNSWQLILLGQYKAAQVNS